MGAKTEVVEVKVSDINIVLLIWKLHIWQEISTQKIYLFYSNADMSSFFLRLRALILVNVDANFAFKVNKSKMLVNVLLELSFKYLVDYTIYMGTCSLSSSYTQSKEVVEGMFLTGLSVLF